MHKGLISGTFNEGIGMKCFWSCFKSGREYWELTQKFFLPRLGNEATYSCFPLFKLSIVESPKISKQILADLFVITRKDHLINVPSFIEILGNKRQGQ